ncbi:MAG: bifunctional aminoglycoside phosphotransferase/ATP-binding protein [Alphaproteobacteria bacterium]
MSEQADAIAFLSDPSNLDGAETVERIDTHCSIVFLAGPRAYKLKRAIRLPYLDYGTPEKRRRMCESELALNRRTAPEIYERVAAVTREADGGLRLDGKGPALDWVVVMKRFAEDDVLDHMAEAGRLDAAMMERLADEIARFHAGIEIHREAGGAVPLRDVFDTNLEAFRAYGTGILDMGRVAWLDALLRAALDRNAPLLERRRAAGKVRQCHGDLHLRNIVMLDGRPTPFDGIEFDDAIARIDVLYDLAFLLMDLEKRGLRPQANAVFNRYLADTGEWDGLPLMPMFLANRAAIRSHVAGATRAQSRGEKAETQEKEARAYLDLALTLLSPPPPRLVAVGGLSGTGKSTLARALAPSFGAAPGAVTLRSDLIRKELAGVAPTTRLSPEAYTRAASAAVYALLCERAAQALAAGHAVVADAVFADPAERASIEAVARAARVPFHGLWLEGSQKRLEARIASRRGDASDATVDVLRRQTGFDLGPMKWTRVNADGGAADTEARARAAL